MKTVQFTVNTQYQRKIRKAGEVLDVNDDKHAEEMITDGLAKSYDRKAAAAAEAEAKKAAAAKAKKAKAEGGEDK